MLVLLGQLDRFRLLVADLYAEATAFRADAQIAIAESAHEVKRLPRRLREREPHRVLLDRALDRLTHLRRTPKEPIGRH
jgi:hypothetical protein